MTPKLLLSMLMALLAVLIWQLGSLWRRRPGSRPVSQDPQPRAVKESPRLAQRAALDDVSQPPLKRERKRSLLAIHANLDRSSAADALLKSGLYNEVESKLTQAFEHFAEGVVSIDGYEAMVRIEGKVVHRKRAELRAREMANDSSPALLDELRQDVEAAEVAIQWCLDWAADLRESAMQSHSDPKQD